ncbi:IS66 family transposase (plasmid) [Pseudarthrobacter sp. P1]|uniref:IS66 family transposase n=1 Tax=Pseudarthrobacter sp. P1 TaxID=3418418 RepID=UPI003CF5D078
MSLLPSYEELAAENAQLRSIVAEMQESHRAQVAELQRLNQALMERVAVLESRLGQAPRNSHKPPGSEGYEKPAPRSRRERTDRSPGGQPGHDGHTLAQVASPDEVLVHVPAACAGCGKSLAGAPVVSTEARQVFDLPRIALRVVEHRIEHRRCGCGRVTMAEAPTGIGAPAQYGPRVRGLATYLLAAQYLPLERTAVLLTELVGAPISQGSLARWYADAAAGLDGFDRVLRDGLCGAPVLGADETGIRVGGSLAWVHAARTDALTRYTVSPRRGFEAMTEAGVLPALSAETVLVTDFWAPYWRFDVTHAVCGAHLGRELVAAAEVAGQQDWAVPLDRLLAEINRTTNRAREMGADGFAPALLATYWRRYNGLIVAGWAANPDDHPGKHAKRRPKHVNLLDRLDTHREEVLRFATDLRVPFTNNGSEQDIRPLKIRMKIAGGLRTAAGAEAFCQLRSYLSTARKQGQSAFAAMAMLHNGNPWTPAIAG